MTQDQPSPSLVKPGRRRLWNVLLALVIFVSGVGIGSGLTLKFITRVLKDSYQEPPILADQVTHRLKRQLKLSDEQAVKVRQILVENLTAFKALREKFRPLLIAQVEKTQHELEAVLTPEQRLKIKRRFHFFKRFWLLPEKDEESSGAQ